MLQIARADWKVDAQSRRSEMVQQVIAVEEKSGERIDNVVFMGMGEPLANLEESSARDSHHHAPWARHRRPPYHRFD